MTIIRAKGLIDLLEAILDNVEALFLKQYYGSQNEIYVSHSYVDNDSVLLGHDVASTDNLEQF